jgi:hypothetical protein
MNQELIEEDLAMRREFAEERLVVAIATSDVFSTPTYELVTGFWSENSARPDLDRRDRGKFSATAARSVRRPIQLGTAS